MCSHTSIKVNAWNATLLLWCAMAMTNGYWTVIATVETINAEDWRERRDVERKSIVCELKEDLRFIDVMCIDMSIKISLRLKYDTHKHIIFPSLTKKLLSRTFNMIHAMKWDRMSYKTSTVKQKHLRDFAHRRMEILLLKFA